MHNCDICKNGVSDFNGRIVCSYKYIYPSFQEYSSKLSDKTGLNDFIGNVDFEIIKKQNKKYLLFILISAVILYTINLL